MVSATAQRAFRFAASLSPAHKIHLIAGPRRRQNAASVQSGIVGSKTRTQQVSPLSIALSKSILGCFADDETYDGKTTMQPFQHLLNMRAVSLAFGQWLLLSHVAAIALGQGSVKNLRPITVGGVASKTFYRAATLDELSREDYQALMDGTMFSDSTPKPLSAVIDLRNSDEIEKKKKTRTDTAMQFYQHLEESSQCELFHVPILYDVDAFWDEAIARMDPSDRLWATLQTVTSAGALDRAAARKLEQEGLSMLYTVTLATAQRRLCRALEICAQARGPVILHCQKGKDRTGLVAMLLQSCLGATVKEIIETYAESGPLIGECSDNVGQEEANSGTFIDWSRFRGSPASAMEDTLDWIQRRHGSIEEYLLNDVCLNPKCVAIVQEKFQESKSIPA